MEKRNLYVIVVVVLVVGLGLSFYGNYTGKAIGDCIDSDRGDYPETPGSVSYTISSKVYVDECYSESGLGEKRFVKERLCLVQMDSKIYKCENGCLENSKGEGYCKEGEANRIYN
tara:strand:+ start:593 stop:937 length:345 start_codon:yes stop_codon:yes gene_type:complete